MSDAMLYAASVAVSKAATAEVNTLANHLLLLVSFLFLRSDPSHSHTPLPLSLSLPAYHSSLSTLLVLSPSFSQHTRSLRTHTCIIKCTQITTRSFYRQTLHSIARYKHSQREQSKRLVHAQACTLAAREQPLRARRHSSAQMLRHHSHRWPGLTEGGVAPRRTAPRAASSRRCSRACLSQIASVARCGRARAAGVYCASLSLFDLQPVATALVSASAIPSQACLPNWMSLSMFGRTNMCIWFCFDGTWPVRSFLVALCWYQVAGFT